MYFPETGDLSNVKQIAAVESFGVNCTQMRQFDSLCFSSAG